MAVAVHKQNGTVFSLHLQTATDSYRFLETGERYNYRVLQDGSVCLSKGSALRQQKIYYTEKDTLIGDYRCEEAFYELPNGTRVLVYTAAALPTALHPFLRRYEGLRGGVVYQKHPVEGESILQSVDYQQLAPEYTQLPKGVPIREEPCRGI